MARMSHCIMYGHNHAPGWPLEVSTGLRDAEEGHFQRASDRLHWAPEDWKVESGVNLLPVSPLGCWDLITELPHVFGNQFLCFVSFFEIFLFYYFLSFEYPIGFKWTRLSCALSSDLFVTRALPDAWGVCFFLFLFLLASSTSMHIHPFMNERPSLVLLCTRPEPRWSPAPVARPSPHPPPPPRSATSTSNDPTSLPLSPVSRSSRTLLWNPLPEEDLCVQSHSTTWASSEKKP